MVGSREPGGRGVRGFTATQITAMVVGLSLALSPVAVRATEHLVTAIRDPLVPSAEARVSSDGRLGMRGEVTQQAGVPDSEWHTSKRVPAGEAKLVWGAPPGSGVALSQITITADGGRSGYAEIWLVSTFTDTGCASERGGGYHPSRGEEIVFEGAVPYDIEQPASQQFTFPIPLTIEPSPSRGVCLYLTSFHRASVFSANGVRGRPIPSFRPAQPKS